MEIITSNDYNLKEIVEKKAKYQKIMLVVGEKISLFQINKFKEDLNGICIFNYCYIDKIDKTEINNGYKLLLFICTVEELLKTKINRNDFDNIYIIENGVLPCFLDSDFVIHTCNDTVILNQKILDLPAHSSLQFNNFYNYLLTFIDDKNEIRLTLESNLSTAELIKVLNSLNNFKCIDLEILNYGNLNYNFLPLIDLILLNAFQYFFKMIEQKNLTLVDIYKEMKDRLDLVDKFYGLMCESNFIDIIRLNLFNLKCELNNVKNKIMDTVSLCSYKSEEVDKAFEAIKTFARNQNSILSYLYLYDVFSH